MTIERNHNYANLGAHIISYVVLTNVLVRTYLEYHVPVWGYLGYYSDYSMIRHIIANFGAVFFAFVVPLRINGLTSLTLTIVVSSTIVSLLAMYAARGYSIFYLVSLYIFLQIVKLLATRIRFRVPPRKGSQFPMLFLAGAGFSISIAWVVARGGLANLKFELATIYSVREVAMDRFFVGPFAYLLNWAQKGFGTAIFAFGLAQRSTLLIGFAVVGQVFFYAALGQKTPIAMLVFVFFAVFVSKVRPFACWLNIVLVIIILASEILIEVFGSQGTVLNSIAVKRVFFAPAEGMILHYEYFSKHGFTYFSDSLLQGVVEYPFELRVMDIISIAMSGDTGVNPNVGILATGYQNMGYLGLLMYAVLAGLILAMFESLSKDLPSWVALAVAGPPMYIMFTSTDLARTMLTHGGLIAMVIIFLWPAKRTSEKGVRVKPNGRFGPVDSTLNSNR